MEAAIEWFNMPKEQRNMVLFMVPGSVCYDTYDAYQGIERNTATPIPSAMKPAVVDTTNSDYNSNVTGVTQIPKNETAKMLKTTTVQINGVEDYKG